MAWPTSAADSDSFNASGSDTTLTFTVDVVAGDLIVLLVGWSDTDDTTVSGSDSASNSYTDHFSGGHLVQTDTAPFEPWGTMLSAVAGTTATLSITVTLGAAKTWREGQAVVIRPDAAGTISLDGTPNGAGVFNSVPVFTGNITTTTQDTNCGLTVCGYSGYGLNPSAELINGTTADAVIEQGGSANCEIWFSRYTTGGTWQGQATLEGSNQFAAMILAFKTVTGGGGPTLVNRESLRRGIGRGIVRGS